jgi:hypothetical protein
MATPNLAHGDLGSLPPNAFDFILELKELLQRVFNDEIDMKDVDPAANHIRRQIAKTKGLVAKLPDVDKSLEEQRAEIKALEERIAKQRAVFTNVAKLDVIREQVERSGGMEVDR